MDNIGNGNEITLKWVYIGYLNMGISLGISLEISLGYIYIYIYMWVNYNDLTATSLESWLIRGIIPKWP